MRPVAAVLALALAVSGLPLTGVRAAAATLNSKLDQLAGTFPGGAALWVSDPSAAQPLYARDADRKLITASLYKLAVLLEVEHQVELGKLHYADTITIDPEDITADGSFEAPGTELTIDEALEQMITVSDNGTALHLWRMLGQSNINAFLVKSGIKDFHIALDESEDNIATPRAIGTFFTLLAKRQLVSAAASERMIQRLERQQINDRIPAQLPEGTIVAHKTGNLVGMVHDAGILFMPQGTRVIVAMTYDTDDAVANELIARLASTVYASVVAAPAAVRYRVPQDTQYAELGTTIALDVTVENIGEEPWTAGGTGRMSMVWELRDLAANLITRGPKPLPLGQVAPGGSVSIPVVVTLPARAGDTRLVVGLSDASGRLLSSFGVATATVPIRVHLPFVAETAVSIPSLMHRREASMVEVEYSALKPVRSEDHALALGWRFIDPATDRIVAQGQQPLGVIKTYARTGTFFAPLVAPNVRGTYILEYEIRERGFIAGVTTRKTIEIGAPRSYGDEIGPGPALRRIIQQQQGPQPSGTPVPTARPPLPTARTTAAPSLRPDQTATPRPTTVPRPSALP
jgi:beta-lactamase class A